MRIKKSAYRVFFENPEDDLLVCDVLRTLPDLEELDVSMPLHTARFRTSLETSSAVKHLLRQLSIISIMVLGNGAKRHNAGLDPVSDNGTRG